MSIVLRDSSNSKSQYFFQVQLNGEVTVEEEIKEEPVVEIVEEEEEVLVEDYMYPTD
jgi:hypothetical protein